MKSLEQMTGQARALARNKKLSPELRKRMLALADKGEKAMALKEVIRRRKEKTTA